MLSLSIYMISGNIFGLIYFITSDGGVWMCSLTGSEGLGEGYDGDIAFASALESFGGGHNDPISVAFGGELKCWNLYIEC